MGSLHLRAIVRAYRLMWAINARTRELMSINLVLVTWESTDRKQVAGLVYEIL